VQKHKGAEGKADADVLKKLEADFSEAVCDDLNIPKALGLVWNMARLETKSDEVYRLILKCDDILSLSLDKVVEEKEEEADVDPEILALIEQRTAAKKAKNYAEADAIRAKLLEMGILLEDTPSGVKFRRK